MTFMLLYTITYNGRWVFGTTLCTVWTVIDYISCTASLTNVVLIAVDRYRSLSQPLKAIRHRSSRRASIGVLVAWLAPTVYWLTVVCAVKWHRPTATTNMHQAKAVEPISPAPVGALMMTSEQCDTDWNFPAVVIVSTVIMFYVPLVAIFVLFALIMNVLRRHAMTFADGRMCQSTTLPHLDGAAGGGETGVRRPPPPPPSRLPSTTSLQGEISDATSSSRHHHFDVTAAPGTDRSSRPSMSPPSVVRLHHSPCALHDVAVARQSSRIMLDRDECQETSGTEKELTVIQINVYDARPSTSTAALRGNRKDSGNGNRYGAAETMKRRHYASQLRAERHETMKDTRLRQQVQAGKTLAAITGFLLLCWVPFSIMQTVVAFCPRCISQRTFDVAIWINYINSAINPVIYCLCNSQYRQAMKMQLMRFCCYSRCTSYRFRTQRCSI